MDREPFSPADGIQPRWKYCYDLVVERGVGDQITYEEVMELIDGNRQQAAAAMDTARRRLEQDGHRSVYTVMNFGWVVASASRQIVMVAARCRKGGRQFKRARVLLQATPRDELSPFERQQQDRQSSLLLAQEELMKRRGERQPLSEITTTKLPRMAQPTN